jgi:hypothetical protein
MDDLFSDAVKALLTDHCTPAVVRAIEAGQPRARFVASNWKTRALPMRWCPNLRGAQG